MRENKHSMNPLGSNTAFHVSSLEKSLAFYTKKLGFCVDFDCPIGDREYGMRDFAIKDLDGNKIGIGAAIQQETCSK
jgi:catechol 2,3-dioxygenase-like lactoylglutathione lyase family enzyme